MPAKKGAPRINKKELEERIDFAAKALSRRLFHSDVKRVITQRYGVSDAQADAYIRSARAKLVEYSNLPREAHRVNSLAFWEGIVASDADLSYRMRAQERLEKLLGLEAPQKHEIVTRSKPITDCTDEELNQIVCSAIEDNSGNNSNGESHQQQQQQQHQEEIHGCGAGGGFGVEEAPGSTE